jgi:hypothetical protein
MDEPLGSWRCGLGGRGHWSVLCSACSHRVPGLESQAVVPLPGRGVGEQPLGTRGPVLYTLQWHFFIPPGGKAPAGRRPAGGAGVSPLAPGPLCSCLIAEQSIWLSPDLGIFGQSEFWAGRAGKGPKSISTEVFSSPSQHQTLDNQVDEAGPLNLGGF